MLVPVGMAEMGSPRTYGSAVSNALHIVTRARADALLNLGAEAAGGSGVGGCGGVLGLGHGHEAGDDDGSEAHVGELRSDGGLSRLQDIKYGISHKRSNSQAERL